MKKIIPFILTGGLVMIFFFLTTNKTFSQAGQSEYKPDTTTTRSGNSSSYTYVKGITPKRAMSLIGVSLGFASLVIGWRARKRAIVNIGNGGRNGAIVALLLATTAILLSIIHLNISAGAVFGSGSGKAGAILSLVLSFIGLTLSGVTLRQKNI
jgi:hypothetical protein